MGCGRGYREPLIPSTGHTPPESEKAVIVYYGPPELSPVVSTKNHTVYWAPQPEVPALMERLGEDGAKKIYIVGPSDNA